MNEIDRLDKQAASPRALLLWRALQGLRSCVSFMNTGAHPDDETSALLAALSLGQGIKVSYACATRGEGGQNNTGVETGAALGVLRTAEMEHASDVLQLQLYWLSEDPADSIHDFGFSKSAEDTLSHWGQSRTLQRFVHIVRQEKPDILCPTFLDVPGQHGHHRAMTSLARKAVRAAADPAFSDVALPPWQVRKLYLPAWSGAGDSYDDALPPPPATLHIAAPPEEPFTGWSYEHIGEHSRRFHRSQGMGRWPGGNRAGSWPLHLLESHCSAEDSELVSGLPATVAALAETAGAASLATVLHAAQQAIEQTLKAFPELPAVRRNASQALRSIRSAMHNCPAEAKSELMHRLQYKEQQLARIVRIAAAAVARADIHAPYLRPGQSAQFALEYDQGDADKLKVELRLPDGWTQQAGQLTVAATAAVDRPYPYSYSALQPRLPALRMELEVDGEVSCTEQPLDDYPLLFAARSASLTPARALLNSARPERTVLLRLSDIHPAEASARLQLPEGWHCRQNRQGIAVTAPKTVAAGLYSMPLYLDEHPAQSLDLIDYPHIGRRVLHRPAQLQLRVTDIRLPDAVIGYVGGGNDRLAHWLRALGLELRELTDSELQQDESLAVIDTLVIGLFAFRTRPVLASRLAAIHRWTEQGGHLLTLYHRPWDNWNPQQTPPRPLTIGKPSLRWRICDETAEINHLLPDHPLLNYPNRIGAEDWQGWQKERGLYFASQWDPAYQALLSMADADEAALEGGLLSARIGKGRHTHTALVLHYQMEKLVPGAFRLMANLLAAAGPHT